MLNFFCFLEVCENELHPASRNVAGMQNYCTSSTKTQYAESSCPTRSSILTITEKSWNQGIALSPKCSFQLWAKKTISIIWKWFPPHEPFKGTEAGHLSHPFLLFWEWNRRHIIWKKCIKLWQISGLTSPSFQQFQTIKSSQNIPEILAINKQYATLRLKNASLHNTLLLYS